MSEAGIVDIGEFRRKRQSSTEVVIPRPLLAMAVMALHDRIWAAMEKDRAEDELAESWFRKWMRA